MKKVRKSSIECHIATVNLLTNLLLYVSLYNSS